MRTQKPELRITRWLRARRTQIPFEAECTVCADAQFKIKYDKRSGFMGALKADADHYRTTLERMFEEHLALVHRRTPDQDLVNE